MKKKLTAALIGLMVILGAACSLTPTMSPETSERMSSLKNVSNGSFVNSVESEPPSLTKVASIIARMATKDRTASVPQMPIPTKPLTRRDLDNLSTESIHIVKLGHSSILLKMEGEYWMLDPVFAERASPVSFAGPRRFHLSPIAFAELPRISRVLISHNHFDHLDRLVMKKLALSGTEFMVPLGVESYLHQWGVPASLITSFEWWENLTTPVAEITFTPSQHFSGRGLFDRNKSLWGSWVIDTKESRIFFSGDTGYFPGFKTIGERYGPFDLTLMETGAYSSEWPDMHLFPEESVQAHLDLRGKLLMPIHNSTFDLAFHPWQEPLERVYTEAQIKDVKLTTPLSGEVITLGETRASDAWWRSLPR